MLPSQQRALQRAFKKADKFDHFRSRTRRTFIGGAIAAAAATATSFWVGVRTGMSSAPTDAGHKADVPLGDMSGVGRRFATASDQDLRSNAALFLRILDTHASDDLLWAGFARLARMSIAGSEQEDTLLAQRLLISARHQPPPSFVREWITDLEKRARR
jgi:hypothetical protein